MPKIDDQEYAAGRDDYANGRSLRALIEPMGGESGVFDEDRDVHEFSRLLGFADALLDQLRRARCVVQPEKAGQ